MRATQFVFLFLIARLSALPTTQGTAPSTSKYPPPVSAVRQPDAPKAPQLKSAATQSGNDGNNMILNQKSLTSPVKIQQQSKSSGKNETNVLKLQSTSDKGLEEILKGTATDNLRTKAKVKKVIYFYQSLTFFIIRMVRMAKMAPARIQMVKTAEM